MKKHNPANERIKRKYFAFLKEALKIYGILYFSVNLSICSAISNMFFSDSTTHGPAKRKKFSESVCFSFSTDGVSFIINSFNKVLKVPKVFKVIVLRSFLPTLVHFKYFRHLLHIKYFFSSYLYLFFQSLFIFSLVSFSR